MTPHMFTTKEIGEIFADDDPADIATTVRRLADAGLTLEQAKMLWIMLAEDWVATPPEVGVAFMAALMLVEKHAQAKATFTHVYERVNDGSPSPYSNEQLAIDEAINEMHKAGHWGWQTLTIETLECDLREAHYPDLCWHYRVTMEVTQ